MIQANDLRVGNWVSDIHAPEGKMWKVTEIRSKTCMYSALVSQYESLRPVRLSPEILEKCGFRKFSHEPGYTLGGDDKKSERCDEYSIGKLSIMDWGNGFILSNSFSFELRIELKSLHQLQNLYFSLCGEELNYTP